MVMLNVNDTSQYWNANETERELLSKQFEGLKGVLNQRSIELLTNKKKLKQEICELKEARGEIFASTVIPAFTDALYEQKLGKKIEEYQVCKLSIEKNEKDLLKLYAYKIQKFAGLVFGGQENFLTIKKMSESEAAWILNNFSVKNSGLIKNLHSSDRVLRGNFNHLDFFILRRNQWIALVKQDSKNQIESWSIKKFSLRARNKENLSDDYIKITDQNGNFIGQGKKLTLEIMKKIEAIQSKNI